MVESEPRTARQLRRCQTRRIATNTSTGFSAESADSAGLADPNMKAQLADLGGTVLTGSPADLGKLIADETEKWAKVVKFAGIKGD